MNKQGDLITDKNQHAKVIILSLLPINQSSDPKVYHDWQIGKDNLKLDRTNKIIKSLCGQRNYTFIDLFNLFLDDEHQLRLDLTLDGTHINYQGYKMVLDKIKSYI